MHDPPDATGLTGFVRRLAGDHAPDADLLRRYAAGRDEAAFAALVKRHGPAVWRACRGLVRQPADAEDAFQATFLLLARNAGRVRNPAAVGAWLYGTAVRVAGKVRAKRRPGQLDVEPAVALGDITVREAEVLFHEELAALPDKFRDPVVLCCLEGLSRDEAAKRLGVTPEAVKHGLERGRELLKARLLRRGVVASVPLLAGLLAPPAGAGVPAVDLHAMSAGAVSLANEVSNVISLNRWKLIAAVGLTALGVGLTALGGDPRQPAEPKGARAKPAEERVAEIALPGPLLRATASRNGKVIATVTENEREGAKFAVVTFWDAATGKQCGTLGEIQNYNPLKTALSPDGSAFAWIHRETVKDNDVTIRVYDTKKGELRCVAGRESVATTGYPDLEFSPDGKRIAIASAIVPQAARPSLVGGATVADVGTGELAHTLRAHTDRSATPVFAGGGKQLLTVGGSDGRVLVWDLETGQQVRSFELTDSERVKANAVTPDGKRLVTFHDKGEIKVWDVETGKHEVTLADPGDEILHTGAVGVSPDGKRAAAVVNPPSGELKLKVWDLKSGKLLLTKGDVGPHAVCFDAAGRVAVCDGSRKKIIFHTVPE